MFDSYSMVDEPVLFFSHSSYLEGTLFFPPDPIDSISIKMWTSEGYQVVSDWKLIKVESRDEKTTILIESKSVPSIPIEKIHQPPNSENSYPATRDGKAWLLFSETGMFHTKQVLISYHHTTSRTIFHDLLPTKSNFQVFSTIPKDQQEIKLLVLGDSISAGGNASKFMNLSPFQPAYPELFLKELQSQFPCYNIVLDNISVGGKTSEWGKQETKRYFKGRTLRKNERIDLAIIAFGANDSGGKIKPRKYLRNINSIISTIQKHNSRVQIVVLNSSLPNPEWNHTNHELLFEYAKRTSERVKNNPENILFVNLSEYWKRLLTFKSFYDISGNGINHPNDFGHQLYSYFLKMNFFD